jgi:hypothetical protein
MFDQLKHRQTVEYEADVERVLVEIEQDPYDEDRRVIETFERWAADDSIDVEQFATAAFRVLRARKNALKADGE